MLKGIIAPFYGNKARRKRAPDGIGRAAIRAAAAIRTRIEIEHVFPGKIFKDLDAKRVQIIQLLIGNSVTHRLDIALFNPHEKNVENRGNHMEMLAQRQEAQEKEKGQIMDKIADQMRIL